MNILKTLFVICLSVVPAFDLRASIYPITTNLMLNVTAHSFNTVTYNGNTYFTNYVPTQVLINGFNGRGSYPYTTDVNSYSDPVTLNSGSLTIIFSFSIVCSDPRNNTTKSFTCSVVLGDYGVANNVTLNINSNITSGTMHFNVQSCPSPPYLKMPNAKACYNKTIDIKASSKLDYGDTSQIFYTCDYRIGSSGTWKSAGGSGYKQNTIHFNPVNDSSSITYLTPFYFRVRASRDACQGLNAYSYSQVDVLPPPPSATLNSATFTKSCPYPSHNGQLPVTNVKSIVATNAYTYHIIRADMDDLTDISDTVKKWGSLPHDFNGNAVIIQNLSPGKQKLFLTYQDPAIKNCLLPILFTIDSLPSLSFTPGITGTSCPEISDGSITFNNLIGTGNYSFYLDGKTTTNPIPNVHGTHYISATDGCTVNEVTHHQLVIVPSPPAVTITDITAKKPDCIDPANGSFLVVASCASNIYDYRIYRATDAQMTNPIIDVPEQGANWTINSLPSGNYIINVRNNNLPNCKGAFVNNTLNPVDTLKAFISSISKVNCFGDNRGSLSANSFGGQPGGYTYHLTNLKGYSNDVNSANHDVAFENLFAGQYTLQVKNANSICNDAVTTSDSIKSNREVHIDLVPKDITCHGDSNGKIATTLSYGSGSYDHNWYKKDPESGEWDQPLNLPLSLTSLQKGNYRLSAWDSLYNCNPVNDSVTIHEPAPLVFDSLKLNDITCVGDSGNIFIKAVGGNGGYTYQDSTSNSLWKNYIPGSPLQPSTYSLRVRDAKLCTTLYEAPQTITNPPDTFNFNYTLSNYNGFQLTCFGSNNGWIKINPFGGNGGRYSGYQSQCQTNGQWLTTDSLKGLTAGTYNLTVQDGRGCAKTQLVTLKQPTSEINLVLTNQRTKCFNDATGSIAVFAYGGTEPYTYSFGSGNYSPINTFNNLAAGKYEIAAKDINGCLQISDAELTTQSPEIVIIGAIVNEKCNGYKEGSIVPAISGGITPYNWLWKETGSDQLEQRYLLKGSYTLKVTDAFNCVTEHRFEVTEPETLTVSSTAKPVCAGTDKGIVRPSADGGTPPYYFGVDKMTDFTQIPEIPMDAGTHNIYVQDANNCVAVTEQIIAIRNTKPWVDFLVPTSRYATDSLVIVDVSWPVPDSVKWTFSPGTKVIVNDQASPIVKFDSAGLFTVTMTGYFSGCDYSRQTDVTIAPYDPCVYNDGKKLNGFEKVAIIPNPNTGFFKVAYKLYPKQRVYFKVLDMYSKLWYSQLIEPTLEGEQAIQLPNAPAGAYVLIITCENDAKSAGFVITK